MHITLTVLSRTESHRVSRSFGGDSIHTHVSDSINGISHVLGQIPNTQNNYDEERNLLAAEMSVWRDCHE